MWSKKSPPLRPKTTHTAVKKCLFRKKMSSLIKLASKNNMSEHHSKEERTLILIKPDALQRHLLGEIIHRFERKGLKIIGLKMLKMDDSLLKDHYGKYQDE